jgi:hypothetical protein
MLKKERERHCHPTARAPCYENDRTNELSSPEAARVWVFNRKASEGSSIKIQRFNAFVAAR